MTQPSFMVGPMVHLGSLGPFRGLPPHQLAAIAGELEEVVFGPEAWVTRKGDEQKALHLVVDGQVRIFHGEGSVLVGPGGVVGFPDLVVPGARSLGALAESDVLAYRLLTDDLRHVCERNWPVLAALLSFMALRTVADPAAERSVIAGSEEAYGPLPGVAGDRVRWMLALSRAPALPGRNMDALAELASRVRPVDLDAGEMLWADGDAAERFWVVAKGSVQVTRDDTSVRVGVGGLPGLPQALADVPRRGEAAADEAALLLAVEVDALMDVLEDHFELAYAVLVWMARWLGRESSWEFSEDEPPRTGTLPTP